MRPLLERLSILRTRDFAQATAFLSSRSIDLALSRADRARFGVRYNGIYLPGMWLGYIGYEMEVTARISPRRDDYWVHFPLHGKLESRLGHALLECDTRRGVVSSPYDVHVLRSDAMADRLSLSIQSAALHAQLATLLGETPRVPVAFAAPMNLEAGPGRSLLRALRAATASLEHDDGLATPLSAAELQESILNALLISQPSNYSEALRKRVAPLAPRDVVRVVDYLNENVARPVRLADLARESGVAGRTLLKHFRDFQGVSPMRYLRELRLDRVRYELRSGRVARVGESAQRWGFTHAGRFSIEYKRRFGESPSATLARRPRR
jgi:AraC-like DNA-binding protein